MSKKTVKDLDLRSYYELRGLKDTFKIDLKIGIDAIKEKADILNSAKDNLDNCKADELIDLLQDIIMEAFDLQHTIDDRVEEYEKLS